MLKFEKCWNLKKFEFEKYLDKNWILKCSDLKFVSIWNMFWIWNLFRFENYSDLKNVPIENVLVWKVQNENMFIFSIKNKTKKKLKKNMWRTRKKKNQRICVSAVCILDLLRPVKEMSGRGPDLRGNTRYLSLQSRTRLTESAWQSYYDQHCQSSGRGI
jgi:hypothetical protein